MQIISSVRCGSGIRDRVPRAALLALLAMGVGFSGICNAGHDKGRRTEPVYGAGPSTHIVSLFFEHFAKRPEAEGVGFLVPERSTKHAGGIRASNQYLFGRTGRPLTEQEKAQNKFEIYLGRVPVGFVTSPAVTLPRLNLSDIEEIFSGQVPNWSDLGGPDAPVVLVGREKTEAVLSVLSKHFPGLIDAEYHQIFKRDHAVVNFLSSPVGKYAIGYGAVSNFDGLNIVELQGPALGVNVGLVVDKRNLNDPLVEAVERYADSEDWRHRIESEGYFAADNAERSP